MMSGLFRFAEPHDDAILAKPSAFGVAEPIRRG